MSSFDARLRLPGQGRLPLNVAVDVSDERLALSSGQETLGEWDLQGIKVEVMPDGFHLTVDQEEIVLTVADPGRFAGELGLNSGRARLQPLDIEVPAPSPEATQNGGTRNGISKRLQGVDLEERFDEIKERVSNLAEELADPSVAPPEFFRRWLNLLKEINRRHGQGTMPTSVFYRLNSELLDLMPTPPSSPPRHVSTTSPL